jgi:hypothetical protein
MPEMVPTANRHKMFTSSILEIKQTLSFQLQAPVQGV